MSSHNFYADITIGFRGKLIRSLYYVTAEADNYSYYNILI